MHKNLLSASARLLWCRQSWGTAESIEPDVSDCFMLKKFSGIEFAFNAFTRGEVLSYQQWVLSTFVISSLQLRFCLESKKLSLASLEIQSCKSECRTIKCLDTALVEGVKLRFLEKEMSKGCSIMMSSEARDWDFVCQFWTLKIMNSLITLMMSWKIQE